MHGQEAVCMGILDALVRISWHFPPLGPGSSSLACLAKLRTGAEPARYSAMALVLASGFGFSGLVCAAAMGVALAVPVGLLAFALPFAFLLRLPALELAGRTAEMETDLPFFLRTAGMLVEMGVPFQRALELAADGDGALAQEIRHVGSEVRDGVGLPRALSSLAMAYGSLPLKRALSQLLSAYETGGGGRDLRKIGDELLAVERHGLREYSARSAMFGLFFMMTSAILPTFFLVYAVLGGFAFGSSLGQPEIALGLLVAFPAMSVLIALVSRASMPRSAFAGSGGFDVRMLLPGAVFLAGFLLLPGFQLPVLAAGVLLAAWFAYSGHARDKRVEEVEAQLPDALFSVSGLPKSTRVERIFELMESGGHGAMSEEAAKSGRQLAMNLKSDAVLDDFGARTRSAMVRRAALMMKQMVATNSLDRLSALADDMLAAFQVKRERAQMFAMQKYTLMAGALLIPLILKTALALLGSMGGLFSGAVVPGADGSGGMGVGTDAEGADVDGTGGPGTATVAATVAFASSMVPPYLVIYALVCSAVIADAEGKRSSAAFYFAVLAAAGLLAFHFINL